MLEVTQKIISVTLQHQIKCQQLQVSLCLKLEQNVEVNTYKHENTDLVVKYAADV